MNEWLTCYERSIWPAARIHTPKWTEKNTEKSEHNQQKKKLYTKTVRRQKKTYDKYLYFIIREQRVAFFNLLLLPVLLSLALPFSWFQSIFFYHWFRVVEKKSTTSLLTNSRFLHVCARTPLIWTYLTFLSFSLCISIHISLPVHTNAHTYNRDARSLFSPGSFQTHKNAHAKKKRDRTKGKHDYETTTRARDIRLGSLPSNTRSSHTITNRIITVVYNNNNNFFAKVAHAVFSFHSYSHCFRSGSSAFQMAAEKQNLCSIVIKRIAVVNVQLFNGCLCLVQKKNSFFGIIKRLWLLLCMFMHRSVLLKLISTYLWMQNESAHMRTQCQTKNIFSTGKSTGDKWKMRILLLNC